MGLFTPYKKHARQFTYVPRYYDPEKEAREQRRAELHGTSAEDSHTEYQPGQYLRRQREARMQRLEQKRDSGRMSIWKIAVGTVLILALIYMLLPRLAMLLNPAAMKSTTPVEAAAPRETVERRSDFDQDGVTDVEWQEQQIVVVPNDYSE